MKQVNKKTNIIIAIIALIIVIGIIMTIVFGFNKELKYKQAQTIEIYIEQEIDKEKIKSIANEVLGIKNTIQTVEIYQDMVIIRAESISEEQKNNLVNKVKENYEFEQTAENTTINSIAATRIRDMYKQYIIPFAISGVIILAYMLIRYYKKGLLKVLARTIIIPVIMELLLLSIMAITRIPVGKLTPVLVIIVYVMSIIYVIKENEK